MNSDQHREKHQKTHFDFQSLLFIRRERKRVLQIDKGVFNVVTFFFSRGHLSLTPTPRLATRTLQSASLRLDRERIGLLVVGWSRA